MKSHFLSLDPILNGYGRWGRIGLLTDFERGICYKLISFNKNLVSENQEVIFLFKKTSIPELQIWLGGGML
jgi:hypothetical protein